MYGTVAYCRAKPGAEAELIEQLRAFEAAKVPGAVATPTIMSTPADNRTGYFRCSLAIHFLSLCTLL